MRIIGMRIEKYIGYEVDGHNCDFTYTEAMFDRHILCGILSDNRKVEITLSESVDQCCSGWCLASFGQIKLDFVDRFNGFTYVPVNPITIDDISSVKGVEEIQNEVFRYSGDGGCPYYPSGGYEVKMELFKETIRAKKNRPVWIFTGESNLGKSFLSAKIQDLEVFETDSCDYELPDKINADIIVLGNRHWFEIDEIKERIFGDSEIIMVEFTK